MSEEYMSFGDYNELIRKYPELFDAEDAPFSIIKDEQKISEYQNQRRKYLQENHLPEEWAEIGVVLNDPYILVLRDLVQFPDGHRDGYCRIITQSELHNVSGVIILPVYEGRILLVRHFRHSTRSWHLEVPRGYGEIGISAEENARKEIEEETGGKVAELFELGSLYPETGFQRQRVDLFLGCLTKIGVPEICEGIDAFTFFTVAEFERAIIEGEINDSFTIASYTRAKLKNLL